MNPERRLRRLCRRHRVPFEGARELLPLLVRASRSSPGVRRSLLAFAEAALASRAAGEALQAELQDRMEQSVLEVLSSLLDGWEPGGAPADGPESPSS